MKAGTSSSDQDGPSTSSPVPSPTETAVPSAAATPHQPPCYYAPYPTSTSSSSSPLSASSVAPAYDSAHGRKVASDDSDDNETEASGIEVAQPVPLSRVKSPSFIEPQKLKKTPSSRVYPSVAQRRPSQHTQHQSLQQKQLIQQDLEQQQQQQQQQQPCLSRQCSRASSTAPNRPPSPPFPSAALSLTQTTSAAGAIYIDWEADDAENPMNWPTARRWALATCCFVFTGVTSLVGTAYNSSQDQITAEFDVSITVFLLGNVTYLAAVAFTPLFLAPLSEILGRREIFIVSAFICAILLIPQALAPNMEAIIITRLFQGASASTGNSVTGGIVADLFCPHDRGLAMSLFALVVFVCQGAGPSAGAYAVEAHGWRVSFWWQFAAAMFSFGLMLAFFKETRGPVLLSRRAARLNKESSGKRTYRCQADDERVSVAQMVKTSVTRPIIYLLTEPIVTFFSAYVALLWAVVFLSIESIPIAFGTFSYGWNDQQSSLVLLILAVGGVLGWCLNFGQERLYDRAWKKYNGDPPPECRLYGCMLGSIMVPIGLFWFGWTCQSSINPSLPIIGLVIFATGVYPIYMCVFIYLSDVYKRYASSALAAQSWGRNLLAGCLSLVATPMYTNVSPPIATSILAVLTTVLGTCPFVLFFFGDRITKTSRVAQALKREEEEMEQRREVQRQEQIARDQRRLRRVEREKGQIHGKGSNPLVPIAPLSSSSPDEEEKIRGIATEIP